jgi:hypothetical protein
MPFLLLTLAILEKFALDLWPKSRRSPPNLQARRKFWFPVPAPAVKCIAAQLAIGRFGWPIELWFVLIVAMKGGHKLWMSTWKSVT